VNVGLSYEQLGQWFPKPPRPDQVYNVSVDEFSLAWRQWITQILTRSDLSLDTKWQAWKDKDFAHWQQVSYSITSWLDYGNADEFLTKAKAGDGSGFGALNPPWGDGVDNWDFMPPPQSFGASKFYYDLLANRDVMEPPLEQLPTNPAPVIQRVFGTTDGSIVWVPTPNPYLGGTPPPPVLPDTGDSSSSFPPQGGADNLAPLFPSSGDPTGVPLLALAALFLLKRR